MLYIKYSKIQGDSLKAPHLKISRCNPTYEAKVESP